MQTRDSDVVVETARLNTNIRTERCRLHAQASWASSYRKFFLEAWAGFGKAKMTMCLLTWIMKTTLPSLARCPTDADDETSPSLARRPPVVKAKNWVMMLPLHHQCREPPYTGSLTVSWPTVDPLEASLPETRKHWLAPSCCARALR